MSQGLTMFSIQGSIWLNKAQKQLYISNDTIEVINPRNNFKDWDKIGETGGNCADPGWYSLTLANIKSNSPDTVCIGDGLKLCITGADKQTKYDLGTYVVTQEDIELGGVVIDFDLAQQGALEPKKE